MNSLSTRPRLIGLLCGAGAVGLGMAYMFAAGAPSSYLLMNLAALILGASLWLALGRAAASGFAGAGAAICAMALVLLGTALLGTPADGAARWIKIGPLGLQVSLILLPAMLVLYARRPGLLGTAGMLVAAVALAAQPDRAMAGVLTAALLVLAVARPARSTAAAAAGAALAFGWTLLIPDRLPAVPFVDRILYTSFDVHPLAGFAVIAGAAALLVPGLAAWRDGADRHALLAFGACWAAAIAAAAIGDYPTPLVGYGGSAVLGYLLSVALLPGRIEETSARGGPASRGGAERAAPCEVAELCAATPA